MHLQRSMPDDSSQINGNIRSIENYEVNTNFHEERHALLKLTHSWSATPCDSDTNLSLKYEDLVVLSCKKAIGFVKVSTLKSVIILSLEFRILIVNVGKGIK